MSAVETKSLRIGEVAELTGTTPRTIRYYEEIGLLPGAVISIAFVLAVVTSGVPTSVLFRIFSGLANSLPNAQLVSFISNMHMALWCLAAISLVGAAISAARPAHVKGDARVASTAAAEERLAA